MARDFFVSGGARTCYLVLYFFCAEQLLRLALFWHLSALVK